MGILEITSLSSLINMRIKAALLTELKKGLKVEEIVLEQELLPGQVLVSITATAICGSQIGEIDGIKGTDHFLPHCLGHEAVGKVLDSRQSNKFCDGDDVILHWMKGDGIDAPTYSYRSDNKNINAGRITTFMSHAVISENRMTRIKQFDEKLVSLYSTIGCAHLTALGVLKNDLRYADKKDVLLVGGGGVAQALISHLLFEGVETIVVVERSATRRSHCLSLGATEVHENTNNLTSRTFDTVIELTGDPQNIEFGYDATNKYGALCLVGVTPFNQKISINPMPLHFGKRIIGSYGGSCHPQLDIGNILSRIESKPDIFLLQQYSVFPIESINEAITEIRMGRIPGRAVVKFS